MDWANDNAICCEHEISKVFQYQERPSSVIRAFPDGRKPMIWTMSNGQDWDNWFEKHHPTLDGAASGLVLILARRSGEPKMEPVESIESNDWIKSIQKVTMHDKHGQKADLRGTGGQRNVRKLPFSEQSFRKIAKMFYIHDSIIRVVSRADVSEFSAVKLDMGRQNGLVCPAYVYNARTSNAWEDDLAVSATYFPHCGLTYAVLFGCTLSLEAEILSRLENATYEICHPLLVPSVLVEIERKRHLPIVEVTLDELEARIQELDEDPESLQGATETEKIARKEAKRSAWLDMLYVRNQLMSWSTCLETLYEHTNRLNRTVFRDTPMCCQYRYKSTEEFSDDDGSTSGSETDWTDSIGEFSLVHSQESQDVNKDCTNVVSMELQSYKYQDSSSIRLARSYTRSDMRRTGAKMRGRLREVIKDYNEKIRECTTGVEGMVMATQWAQGETNVEIALATSQDSRHMRSIALVTMIFLPGTFFASMFSMGFFEWKADGGTISVSRSFWIYVVLATGFTAFTVGAWWYLGVYRYKRHRDFSSVLKLRQVLSPRQLKPLLRRAARAMRTETSAPV
ncbi:hypothetical protein Focb16_v004623 [Fusarium oxysporum f. sp. cubense]|uniref:Uncharacterized protein n=1 Tax=Fusarium oxysporum f. sp. cubense TaxID=61366 RepID=A0A559LJM5_FUSOC|nr:hypothetical protein Focb16_v004623 [Fusarium oxysporum f. sp. cubense]